MKERINYQLLTPTPSKNRNAFLEFLCFDTRQAISNNFRIFRLKTHQTLCVRISGGGGSGSNLTIVEALNFGVIFPKHGLKLFKNFGKLLEKF